jgi:hypothetical protein
VDLLLGITVAIVLGVILGVLIARWRGRWRARHQPGGRPPHDVAGLLTSYRHGRYEEVIDAAPAVVASMGAVTGTAWRSRVELVWGHSLFELDRFEESIEHFRRGLEESPAPQEAEVRFVHCLGFALQMTGQTSAAMQTYEGLLADPDLDPAVRAGVERNLSELRKNGPVG